jgi:hypothetical protein
VLTRLLSVFALGMIGLWEGIPLGFVLRLPPLAIGLASALGSTIAMLLVLLLGEGIRARLARRRGAGSAVQKERLIDRVWRSYGLVGFALLAPGLLGAPIGVATGILLGAPTRRLVPWLLAGIALWSVILTVAGAYGSAGIRALIVR